MSWINDLDMCASLGIINFDAPAYIRGTNPRYVGNPELEMISGQIPDMKPQPQKDEFNKEISHGNPTWKKWVFGIFATGLAVLGAYKLRNTKVASKIVNYAKNLPQKITNLATTGWNKLKNVFKKTP